jgi:hypothetical protein
VVDVIKVVVIKGCGVVGNLTYLLVRSTPACIPSVLVCLSCVSVLCVCLVCLSCVSVWWHVRARGGELTQRVTGKLGM